MSEPQLTFWHNIPSVHQAPLIREVARRWPGPVLLVAEEDVPQRRLVQGWSKPDFGGAEVIVAPRRDVRAGLVARAGHPEDVNLFSGIDAYPETYWTLRQLGKSSSTLGVMVEPGRHDQGWRTLGRRLRHSWLAARWGKRLGLILATGELGRRWWCSVGMPEHKVVPFGYVTEMPEPRADSPRRKKDPARFQLVYVGSLTEGKAPDLLIQALDTLKRYDWILHFIGSGPLEAPCRKLVEHSGLSGRVRWVGNVPNRKVYQLLSAADVLVLPSRYDGWGAVVNEALSVGTPVVVSDACGAQDLVVGELQGAVFRAGSIGGLRAALQRRLELGIVNDARRASLRAWAARAISPSIMAGYLLTVLEAVRSGTAVTTLPPWLAAK